jgi:Na+-translocating ferredoxin:NAD+ oxidoreductase RnfG subunit
MDTFLRLKPARSWLKQFKGADKNKTLKVNKNIDAIAGATISVYSLTDDVNLIIRNLNLLN